MTNSPIQSSLASFEESAFMTRTLNVVLLTIAISHGGTGILMRPAPSPDRNRRHRGSPVPVLPACAAANPAVGPAVSADDQEETEQKMDLVSDACNSQLAAIDGSRPSKLLFPANDFTFDIDAVCIPEVEGGTGELRNAAVMAVRSKMYDTGFRFKSARNDLSPTSLPA